MKLAVTYEAETKEIFQHFGHTGAFKIYEVEEGAVRSEQVVGTDGAGHGALAGFLKAQGVTALICGGIGGGARAALSEAGIALYPGAVGDADQNVAAYLQGTLSYDPDTTCSHHGDHGGEHHCGQDGAHGGEHHCGQSGEHHCGQNG